MMACQPRVQLQAGTLTYGTVLVPLDGSHVAAQALPHAMEVARLCCARMVLLYVMSVGRNGTPSRDVLARRSQTEAYFGGLKRSLERYGVQVDWQIEEGEVAKTIAAVARQLDRPLVVLTEMEPTAGRSARRTRVGSVAKQLSKHWDGPVSTIKAVA